MMFEDERLTRTPEMIAGLLKESLEFKFGVKLIAELEAMMAAYRWLGNVQKEVSGKSGASIEALQSLIAEGKTHKYDMKKVEQLSELLHAATQLKSAIQKVMKSDKTVDADLLEELQGRADKIGVEMKEKHALGKLVTEVRSWRENCHKVMNGTCRIDSLELLKTEAERLKVTCKEYEKLREDMQPVIQWLDNATQFLKKFSSSSAKAGNVSAASTRSCPSKEQILQLLKKKNSPEKHLESLLAGAINDIAKMTEEYQQLKAMKERLDAWEASAGKIIEKYLAENTFSKEEIQTLVKKIWEHPINKETVLKLLDICDHAEWIVKAKEALAGKVPVHVLESVFREGNCFSVKTNEINGLLKRVEEKISAAKQWISKHKQMKQDIEKRQDKMHVAELEQILKEGESLNVKIREIEWLTELYSDVKNLRADIHNALQGSGTTFSVLEALIAKVEGCEVSIPELALLKALYEVCKAWRKIALQVIRSRQILSLSLLNTFPEAAVNNVVENKEYVSIVVEKGADGKFSLVDVQASATAGSKASTESEEESKVEYCVCRRGDEDEQEMIECDVCDEWFHLECINLSKELAGTLQHFVCSACVKRKQIAFYYPDCLDSIQRINEQDFERLLQEGRKIPVHFTELKLLEEVRIKMERWKQKVRHLLGLGIQYELYVETFEGKKERAKRDRFGEVLQVEKMLMKHYLESENFPVETELSRQLMHMLWIRDWIKEALKCRHSKISGRKCRKILEQGQTLAVFNYPVLKGLFNEFLSLYNHQQQSVILPNGNAGPEEDVKEETKRTVSSEIELAAKLANAIQHNNVPERNITEMYEALVNTADGTNPNVRSVVAETMRVLLEVDKFKSQVKDVLESGLKDAQLVEGLCRRSLSLGCVPEDVFDFASE